MQGPRDISRLRKQFVQRKGLWKHLLLVDEEVRQKMEELFDVAYMVAKLELPFTVYPSLCSLEKKTWGVVREHLPKRQGVQELCGFHFW